MPVMKSNNLFLLCFPNRRLMMIHTVNNAGDLDEISCRVIGVKRYVLANCWGHWENRYACRECIAHSRHAWIID